MSEQTTSRGKYWLGSIVFVGITVALLFIAPQFFWVTLPFAGVFSAKALDVI